MSGERYPAIAVLTACAMHLIWSIGLVLEPHAINATGLHTVLVVAQEPIYAAFLFGLVAMLAIVGVVKPNPFERVMWMLPQQAILWFSVVGAGNAMYLGQFADGIQRSHWFLIVDQIPVVLIAVGHTAAMLYIAERGDG